MCVGWPRDQAQATGVTGTRKVDFSVRSTTDADSVSAMRAWRVTRYGAPADVLALEEIDTPQPGAGELLVRGSGVTLNFTDLDGIHGRYKTVPIPVPYTPGREILGRVERAGAGAESWVGTR